MTPQATRALLSHVSQIEVKHTSEPRISLKKKWHCIVNTFANSSVSPVPTLRTRLARSSRPDPADVQQVGRGALDKPGLPDVWQVLRGAPGQAQPGGRPTGRTRSSRTSPTHQTSGRSGEELQDKPDPPDVRQVGRGSAPLECLPDPPDVRQVGRACPIIQMLALHTANLSAEVDIWAFAEAARPARSPAGRAGSSGRPASARPARHKARPGRPKVTNFDINT